MQDLNAVAIIGRLTSDLGDGFQILPTGTAKAAFSIAVNRNVKHGEAWETEASFFDIELLGKQAEGLKPFLIKGKQVAVYGSLIQDRWEKDGAKYSRIKIHADSVQLLGGNKPSEENGQTFHAVQHQAPAETDNFINEDIPF